MLRPLSILLALVLAIGCAGSKAARTGSIVGAVLDDSTGAALRYACVRLIRSDQEVEVPKGQRWRWQGAQAISTGREGKFVCKGLSPGSYLAQASCLGYRWHETLRIDVQPESTTSVVFRMQLDPTGAFKTDR